MVKNSFATTMRQGYAMYMMLTSYFEKKPTCVNPQQEEKMYLYYQDVNNKDQYRMEEKCISYIEKRLVKALPEEIWSEKMIVTLGNGRIILKGKKYVLTVDIDVERAMDQFCVNLYEQIVVNKKVWEDGKPAALG